MLWTDWWLWLAAAAVFGTLEVFVPGFILLGFAISATAMSALLAATGPEGFIAESMPRAFLAFAVLSLIAAIGLRRAFPKSAGEVQSFEKDINEN
ncbi:MAG: hypothetical protein AAF334_01215 [Pseudomonadota bacterium]